MPLDLNLVYISNISYKSIKNGGNMTIDIVFYEFQLKGEVDDCSCTVDSVDSFNNFKIYPRINSLVHKDFFRYWNVSIYTCHRCYVKLIISVRLPRNMIKSSLFFLFFFHRIINIA